jgi:hypothetical protein
VRSRSGWAVPAAGSKVHEQMVVMMSWGELDGIEQLGYQRDSRWFTFEVGFRKQSSSGIVLAGVRWRIGLVGLDPLRTGKASLSPF